MKKLIYLLLVIVPYLSNGQSSAGAVAASMQTASTMFATWDAAYKAGDVTLYDGDLTEYNGGSYGSVLSTIAITDSAYWEIFINSGSAFFYTGIATRDMYLGEGVGAFDDQGYGFRVDGYKYNNGFVNDFGEDCSAGETTIGFAYSNVTHQLQVWKNTTYLGVIFTTAPGVYYAAAGARGTTDGSTAHFSTSSLNYPGNAPANFKLGIY